MRGEGRLQVIWVYEKFIIVKPCLKHSMFISNTQASIVADINSDDIQRRRCIIRFLHLQGLMP